MDPSCIAALAASLFVISPAAESPEDAKAYHTSASAFRLETTSEEPPIIVYVYNFDFSANPAGEMVIDPVIQVGDTVRWVWEEGTHTTTAASGQLEFWDSPVLNASDGGSFEHTFTTVGSFVYYNRLFGDDLGDGNVSGMSGVITVVPESRNIAFLMALLIWFKLSSRHRPALAGTLLDSKCLERRAAQRRAC